MRQCISEISEFVFAISPIFLDFDVELQKHFLLKKCLYVFPCRRAYLFDSQTIFTYDYTLLAIALAIDDSRDIYDILLLFKLLDGNLHAIRHFFVVTEKYLFAYDFVYKKSFGAIGQSIFVEIRWRLG